MRIGLIGSTGQFNYNSYSSRERYMPELYKNLKLLNKDTHKIMFNTLPFIGRAFSITAKSLITDFKNYDIIHNISQDPIYLLKKNNARLITTIHFSPEQPKFFFEKNFKTMLWLNSVIKLNFMLLKHSDHLIANSTQTKSDIHKSLGISNSQISTISLGIDKRYLLKPNYRKRNNNNKYTVGYLGIITSNKNTIFAVKAFKLLSGTDLTFKIWGKPIFSNRYYKNIINIAESDKRINFMGYAPGDKIIDIYDSFDIFTFPTYYESFGLPILEAQSRGLPVIIYKYGKIPKEVRKYCFEAESPEHMAQIIENIKENGYNEKLKEKATAYARSFTWEKTAKETFELYKRISKN
ncbi:MAG: glycosyltransferase [Candidatus Parvarchaeum sp.]